MQPLLLSIQWLLLILLAGSVAALVSLPFRRRTAPAGASVPEWWRCNACGQRWRSHGATWVSTTGLKVRQRARRRARAADQPEPAWAARRGTKRCPSCLSRSIRPSRQQH